ncbi:MAG: hypothetical protein MZW92_70945 [Comamonadaceae bacterium]|nr:hypothetical protein [Comamonadaceae bacterium]
MNVFYGRRHRRQALAHRDHPRRRHGRQQPHGRPPLSPSSRPTAPTPRWRSSRATPRCSWSARELLPDSGGARHGSRAASAGAWCIRVPDDELAPPARRSASAMQSGRFRVPARGACSAAGRVPGRGSSSTASPATRTV